MSTSGNSNDEPWWCRIIRRRRTRSSSADFDSVPVVPRTRSTIVRSVPIRSARQTQPWSRTGNRFPLNDSTNSALSITTSG